MTDAVHDQHWRLARDHDRTVATGPAVSSPRVPNFFAEVMVNPYFTQVRMRVWCDHGT